MSTKTSTVRRQILVHVYLTEFVVVSVDDKSKTMLSSFFDDPTDLAKQGSNILRVFRKVKPCCLELISRLMARQDPSAPIFLLKMYASLKYACRQEALVEYEFKEFIGALGRAISFILSVSSLDDNEFTLYRVLAPTVPKEKLMVSKLFEANQVISLCINAEIKVVFESPNVSLFLDRKFYETTRGMKGDSSIGGILSAPRYCPAVMFFLNGASAIIFTFFAAEVLWSSANYRHVTTSGEVILAIMIIGNIVYEIGELHEINYNISLHQASVWNRINSLCTMMSTWWLITFFNGTLYDAHGLYALGLAVIPMSMGLLKYLSHIKSLGMLVIIVFNMFPIVGNFVIVGAFSILGFGIAFRGLFGSVPSGLYETAWLAFQNLFAATFGQFQLNSFEGSQYQNTGIWMLVIYVTFTLVLLINLVVARMANVQRFLEEDILAQWGYLKATFLYEHFLTYERSPLSMLCPPLNLIPATLFMFRLVFQLFFPPAKNATLRSYEGSLSDIILKFVFLGPIALNVLRSALMFGTLRGLFMFPYLLWLEIKYIKATKLQKVDNFHRMLIIYPRHKEVEVKYDHELFEAVEIESVLNFLQPKRATLDRIFQSTIHIWEYLERLELEIQMLKKSMSDSASSVSPTPQRRRSSMNALIDIKRSSDFGLRFSDAADLLKPDRRRSSAILSQRPKL